MIFAFYFFLWWLFGVVGGVYFMRQRYDVTLSDFIQNAILAITGPVSVLAAWIVYADPTTSSKKPIILFKKRNKK